jgi:hypothetical protein
MVSSEMVGYEAKFEDSSGSLFEALDELLRAFAADCAVHPAHERCSPTLVQREDD